MTTSDAAPQAASKRRHRVQRGARSVVYARVTWGVVILDLLVIAMVVANVHGPTRFVLGLLFAMTVPGWALVGALRLGHPLLEVSLCVAASLSILVLVAQLAITVGWWHLAGVEVIVGLLALPALVWQALQRPVSRGAPR
jgi:uncharacterized membrane protein